ncbi:metallophosphoesterase [Humisphaera borealis]|uniref:Metallophosphoesterase n=1 Tax=Humisphaera borealis TaxID=2807512 RepID=A0A7M2WX07_9BACT|nr:metallophosphoesterase [Humisphaera borealis]QOV89040.1 metallophosphoesterase [Humisphaera borealis]
MARLTRLLLREDVLWVGALVLILLFTGLSAADRPEEVAVLDTARQMLGGGFDRWMIPRIEGSARLEGPPLAYWLAAGSYKIFGVREFAGRLPFAIAGWLTALLTCRFATRLYGRRAGWLAGVGLLGTWLFARHTQLAEPDMLAALFVTLGVYAIHNACDPNNPAGKPRRLFHIAGLAIGLTALSNGLPAVFPVLFLLGIAGASRSTQPLVRFVRSGAPLTALAVMLPWLIFVVQRLGSDALFIELRGAIYGTGVTEPLYSYAPWLVAGLAPWTGLALLALIIAGARLPYDRRSQRVFWWLGATLVPLLLIGTHQRQFLLPALPPILVLTGWLVDRWLRMPMSSRLVRYCRRVAVGTAACLGGAIAIPFAASTERGTLGWADAAAVGGLVLLVAALFWLRVRLRSTPAAGIYRTVVASGVAVTLLVGLWLPTLQPINARSMSRLLTDQFGPRQYCFYGTGDPALAYSLRRSAPVLSQREQLEELLVREPRTVVLLIGDNSQSLPGLPTGLVVRATFKQGVRTLHACEYAPEILTPPDGVIVGRISPQERQVNLLVTGDWGQETIAQAEVAATMSLYGVWHRPPIDAVMFVGDNFYVPLRDTNDSAWQVLFEKRFRTSDLPIPFYAILGNHDYEGHKDGVQLAYAREHPGTRWKMPARWYRVDLPPDRPLVTALMLDSNHSDLTPADWAAQKRWLADQLSQPRSARWTIALAHHPLFSNGMHGDSALLQREWGDLLQRGKVDFYIAGHDHDMQHLEIPGYSTQFLVCGGGGAEIRAMRRDDRGPFSRSMHGFTHLRFGELAMEAACVDQRGKQAHLLSHPPASASSTRPSADPR